MSSNKKNGKKGDKKSNKQSGKKSDKKVIKKNIINNNNTISGVNKNNILIPIFSSIIGILVFICIPYAANQLNKPFTAAALNVIPNGMILGYFVLETQFETYFKSLIFVPSFNVIINIITYGLYKYCGVTPFWALTINILAWVMLVISSYIIPAKYIPSLF
jgi:hypothetical protein